MPVRLPQRSCEYISPDHASRTVSALTLPSVTVRNVSMTLSLVSVLGVSSRNPMTTCTILVMACLSCPCFFDNSSTCSFNEFQSPASLHIVTIATSDRDVEARSEDCGASQSMFCYSKARVQSTCLACFSRPRILSIPLWTSV